MLKSPFSPVLAIGRKVLRARTLTLYSNPRSVRSCFLYIQVNLRVERILNFFRLASWLCGENFFFFLNSILSVEQCDEEMGLI